MKKQKDKHSSTFDMLFDQLISLEKLSKKYYQQIRKAAYTPELSKALHEEQTAIKDHFKRLKLIQKEVAITMHKHTPKQISVSPLAPISHGRIKEAMRDVLMIASVQQVLQAKVTCYKLLYPLSVQMGWIHTPSLLKQSIMENEATYTWLERIAQRAISGETIVPQGL